ncbi:MAG: hypothetical protein ACP5M0_15580 [Desulfomonilaceae bacterium]
MIFRDAEPSDIPRLEELFSPWISHDPSVSGYLEGLRQCGAAAQSPACCVLAHGRDLAGAILSVPEGADRRKIVACAARAAWDDLWLKRFLELQIMDWEDQGIRRVAFRVPATAERGLFDLLRSVGFFSEGASSSLEPQKPPRVHLCKHFLYETVHEDRLLDFLKDVFQRLGYEIKDEHDAFSFRPSPTLLLPFLFGPWHRISRIGDDVILQPPVRRIEHHELETAFYPLRILGRSEKPLLLIMDAKKASRLIDLPHHDLDQGSLFPRVTLCRARTIHLTDITCTHPSAARLIRKGLPLLFYVHKIGAVGWARVDDWDVDEPARLCRTFPRSEEWDPADIDAHAAASGPLAGKALAVRFHWFKPFTRAVSFDQMRAMDPTFHPQRARTLSPELFHAVLQAGRGA